MQIFKVYAKHIIHYYEKNVRFETQIQHLYTIAPHKVITNEYHDNKQ